MLNEISLLLLYQFTYCRNLLLQQKMARRKNVSQETKRLIKAKLKTTSARQIAREFDCNLSSVLKIKNSRKTIIPETKRKNIELSSEHLKYNEELLLKGMAVTSQTYEDSLYANFKNKFKDFKISASVFRDRLKKENYRLKKVAKQAYRKNEMKHIVGRGDWFEKQIVKRNVNYFDCVFVDESGFDMSARKERAWALKGQIPYIENDPSLDKSEKITCIGAICFHGLICMAVKSSKRDAAKTLENSIASASLNLPIEIYLDTVKNAFSSNSNIEERFFENNDTNNTKGTQRSHFMLFLWNLMKKMYTLRQYHEYKYIYLDNAAIHKGPAINNLIHVFNLAYSTNFELLYAYPYSPDLNPIELYWSMMKNLFRKSYGRHSNIVDRIVECASQIQLESIQNCILHMEKPLSLVKNLKPLLEKNYIKLDIPRNYGSKYSKDSEYTLAENLESLRSSVTGLVGIYDFHKGKRVYFETNEGKFKCSYSKVVALAPEILNLQKVADDNSRKRTREEDEIIPSSDFKILSYSEGENTIHYTNNGEDYVSTFDELKAVAPTQLKNFFLPFTNGTSKRRKLNRRTVEKVEQVNDKFYMYFRENPEELMKKIEITKEEYEMHQNEKQVNELQSNSNVELNNGYIVITEIKKRAKGHIVLYKENGTSHKSPYMNFLKMHPELLQKFDPELYALKKKKKKKQK